MSKNRPYVLTIAGHDPSGGAGVLADVKTFEQNKVNGFSVTTSLTLQDENEFVAIKWVGFQMIKDQIDILFQNHQIDFVKIGLIDDLAVLAKTINLLRLHNPEIFIAWDPIVKSSTGFDFHETFSTSDLTEVLGGIDLVTPNRPEMEVLIPNMEVHDGAKYISKFCNVLLKGGHNDDIVSEDILFRENGSISLTGTRSPYKKHGTGCVLSASIVANLANGDDLFEACKKAKQYIEKFINSNPTMLGYHLN